MINRVYNVSKPEHPLKAFDQLNHFKLFLFGAGLLKYIAGIDNAAILLKSDYQFKGPLTQNYVLQQLQGQLEVEPRFLSNKYGEIDFIIQDGIEVIPIEVKGGEDKGLSIVLPLSIIKKTASLHIVQDWRHEIPYKIRYRYKPCIIRSSITRKKDATAQNLSALARTNQGYRRYQPILHAHTRHKQYRMS